MPRIARIVAPGHPHHVTQRGNNRAPVFFDEEVRATYLDILSTYAQKHTLRVWPYCLMVNHIKPLGVPEEEDSLARAVGLTNQVYTQYLNRNLGQSGRIWQNRFYPWSNAKAHLAGAEDTLLDELPWLDEKTEGSALDTRHFSLKTLDFLPLGLRRTLLKTSLFFTTFKKNVL